MSTSVAQTHNAIHSEGVRAVGVFPSYIQEGSYKIIQLIRDYYNYLNSPGMPSYELNRMVDNHDIDEVSDKYIEAIRLAIAKNVPDSQTLDKARLYKVISKYYKTRGSEESIYTFFKLFFNEIVTVTYPQSRVFNSSANQSKSSDRFALQDGNYFQKYSYEIRSGTPADSWRDSYLKFVHPAGLNLFFAFIVILQNSNNWEGSFDLYIDNILNITPEEYWKNIKWESLVGYHNPKFQAGVEYDIELLLHAIINEVFGYRTQTHPIPGVDLSYTYATLIQILFDIVLTARNAQPIQFREDYQQWLKFLDNSAINEGYLNKTIGDANAKYDPANICKFESLASQLNIDDGAYSPSYIDITDLDDLDPAYTVGEYVEDDFQADLNIQPGYLPDFLTGQV